MPGQRSLVGLTNGSHSLAIHVLECYYPKLTRLGQAANAWPRNAVLALVALHYGFLSEHIHTKWTLLGSAM